MIPFLWLGTCHITFTEEFVTSLIDTFTGIDGTESKINECEASSSSCLKPILVYLSIIGMALTAFICHDDNSSTGPKALRVLNLEGHKVLGEYL